MIEVRVPNLAEITDTVKMCRRLHAASDWADEPFSPAKMRSSIMKMISNRATTVFVAFDGSDPVGVLLGVADHFVYNNSVYATDVEFVAERGGDELLEAFKSWASMGGAKHIIMGVSNKGGGSEAAKERFFKKHGFSRTGGMYMVKL